MDLLADRAAPGVTALFSEFPSVTFYTGYGVGMEPADPVSAMHMHRDRLVLLCRKLGLDQRTAVGMFDAAVHLDCECGR